MRRKREGTGDLIKAYRAEYEAARLYQTLAEAETDPVRRRALESIAHEEAAHASYWASELRRAGGELPEPRLTIVPRALIWFGARFGAKAITAWLAAREAREASRYYSHPEMRLEERRHGQVVRALGRGDRQPLAVDPWSTNDGFNLRAAIFGVNDGLVSNLSLTAGLAGAQVDPRMVLLGGAAGLLAGALSMAGGEYLSVRSQQELAQRQLAVRLFELAAAPEHAARLLSATYQSRGLLPDDAGRVAAAVLSQNAAADKTEIAGLGSPTVAAATSFTAFALGAAVPLIPYLFTPRLGLTLSIAASAFALACVGALLGLMSGRPPAYSAGRMLGIGGVAAAVTYFAGRLFNLSV